MRSAEAQARRRQRLNARQESVARPPRVLLQHLACWLPNLHCIALHWAQGEVVQHV